MQDFPQRRRKQKSKERTCVLGGFHSYLETRDLFLKLFSKSITRIMEIFTYRLDQMDSKCFDPQKTGNHGIKFSTLVLRVDLSQEGSSKTSRSSAWICRTQRRKPETVPRAARRSAILHISHKGLEEWCLITNEKSTHTETERERPFQSAGTFSLVTTAPHSLEVVRTTLKRRIEIKNPYRNGLNSID